MRLFLYEMKKIFSWKLIFIIVLINILIYKMMIEFDLEYFPNGSDRYDFKIEQQMIEEYGVDMDESEFLDFKATYEEKVAEADSYLANDPKAIAVGMDSYEKFRYFDRENKEQDQYYDEILFHSKNDFPWELQAYEWHIAWFENEEEYLKGLITEATGNEKKRYEELLEERKFSYFTNTVTDNFRGYKSSMAIVIFLSVMILISPIFLRDVSSNVVPLQYSSKQGRRVYKIKWFAGFFSTIILTSALLILYLSLYSTNGTSSHFALPMYKFSNYYWYDITFLQYIIVSVIVILLLAIVLGVLTMAISSIVHNWIALIAVQIVVAFVMIAGGVYVVVYDLMQIKYAQGFVPSIVAIFILVTIVFTSFVYKREQKKDIV